MKAAKFSCLYDYSKICSCCDHPDKKIYSILIKVCWCIFKIWSVIYKYLVHYSVKRTKFSDDFDVISCLSICMYDSILLARFKWRVTKLWNSSKLKKLKWHRLALCVSVCVLAWPVVYIFQIHNKYYIWTFLVFLIFLFSEKRSNFLNQKMSFLKKEIHVIRNTN